MRRKSERGCQPWGRHPRSVWLTVLTPANHGAEGFTNRPVTYNIHYAPYGVQRSADGAIGPHVVPSRHPTPARGGRAITRRPPPPTTPPPTPCSKLERRSPRHTAKPSDVPPLK